MAKLQTKNEKKVNFFLNFFVKLFLLAELIFFSDAIDFSQSSVITRDLTQVEVCFFNMDENNSKGRIGRN